MNIHSNNRETASEVWKLMTRFSVRCTQAQDALAFCGNIDYCCPAYFPYVHSVGSKFSSTYVLCVQSSRWLIRKGLIRLAFVHRKAGFSCCCLFKEKFCQIFVWNMEFNLCIYGIMFYNPINTSCKQKKAVQILCTQEYTFIILYYIIYIYIYFVIYCPAIL